MYLFLKVEEGSIKPINFRYVNHRGEFREVNLIPTDLSFKAVPDYYPQPQWLLTGWDIDKQATRTFSLSRIVIEEN